MKPRRKRRWLKWAGGITALGLGVGIYLTRDVWAACLAFDAEYKAARSEGALLTIDEIAASMRVPEDQDAMPILRKMSQALDKIPENEQKRISSALSSPRDRSSAADPKAMTPDEALKQLQPVLAYGAELLKKPVSDPGFGLYTLTDEFFAERSGTKMIVRALVHDAERNVAAGNYDRAAALYSQALHFSGLVGQSPTMIDQLVRIALEAIVFANMNRQLATRCDDPEVNRLVRTALKHWRGPIDMKKMVRAEIAVMYENFSHVYTGGDESTSPPVSYEILSRIPPVRTAWRYRALVYIRQVHQTLEASGGDSSRLVKMLPEVSDELAKASGGFSHYLDEATELPIRTLANASEMIQVRRDLVLASLDIVDFQLKNGKWPPTLPIERIDRLSGKPLRYEIREGRPVLWSVGGNRTDDGGIPFRLSAPGRRSDDVIVDFRAKPTRTE